MEKNQFCSDGRAGSAREKGLAAASKAMASKQGRGLGMSSVGLGDLMTGRAGGQRSVAGAEQLKGILSSHLLYSFGISVLSPYRVLKEAALHWSTVSSASWVSVKVPSWGAW